MIFFRIKTTIRVHADYLEVGCEGLYSRAETLRVGEEAYAAAARANRGAILVDARAITGRIPTILDRFEMGVRIARHYLETDPRIRLAVVGHEPMIHPERFGELVARNRGADARVFTDGTEALDWLLRRPTGG
jgi:hypothetical protein